MTVFFPPASYCSELCRVQVLLYAGFGSVVVYLAELTDEMAWSRRSVPKQGCGARVA